MTILHLITYYLSTMQPQFAPQRMLIKRYYVRVIVCDVPSMSAPYANSFSKSTWRAISAQLKVATSCLQELQKHVKQWNDTSLPSSLIEILSFDGNPSGIVKRRSECCTCHCTTNRNHTSSFQILILCKAWQWCSSFQWPQILHVQLAIYSQFIFHSAHRCRNKGWDLLKSSTQPLSYVDKNSSVAILIIHWRSSKDVARQITKVSSFLLVLSDAIIV